MTGFKSFADRTEFTFGSGITAVVGPNGCGKSNILDAVRWVLGEQSARSLRGDRMLDVVFSGSRSRKPANFAEVELVFDNRAGVLRSDDTEVTVGRVLYRSGDSEYRLNGKSCRLKDIRELLLDTGVGVDAYSVIEQGRVDSLLQASPIERREIFEEAAGISRYKVRRAEAQRKLDRTQNNLLRLRDIIEELERRLRSVRLAAGKARNFQEYDARLRELRSSFSLAEYHELEQSHQRLRREIESLEEALQEERARLSQTDASAAELSRNLQAQDDKIQTADAELQAIQNELSALAERIAQGERRATELATTRERRRAQAQDIADRQAALEQREREERTNLEGLCAAECDGTARIAEIEEARQAAEARYDAAQQTLEQERTAAFEAVRRATQLQSEGANLDQQRTRLQAQVDRLDQRQADVAKELAEVNTRCNELGRRVDELDQAANELGQRIRKTETALRELGEEAGQLDRDIGAAKEARSALLSRLGLLEDMERRFEGVDQGTRAVLSWREADPGNAAGVIGLAAELLRIDDPRVALLEPILGTFEGHVVVRDSAAFLAELQQREAVSGSVRVLALDRLHARPLASGYESTPGFVARASDWVTCPDAYRPLAEHVLGRVIVVETAAQALRLADQALAGYVFVSLDGWTVHGDGRLAWGGASTARGLISRKAEIRQLRQEQDEVESRLARLTRRRMEVEEAISDLQLRKQALLEEIAGVQREHGEVRSTLARADDQRQRLQREARVTASELAGQRRALDELLEAQRRVAGETEAVDASQRSHEARVAELTHEVAALEQEVEKLGEERTAARVETGRVTEKRAAAEQSLRDLAARRTALAAECTQARQEADEAEAEIDAAREETAAAQREHASRTLACEQRRREVMTLRDQRQGLRQRIEECGEASRSVQQRIDAAESTLHEKQMSLRECDVRRETLVARVQEELELDLAECYATYEHAEQDWQEIKAEIEELRGKIARLGNVNLDAIAELEELTPRYEHLQQQQADLVDSIERLEKLIGELDEESRTRFAESFEQIRSNFQEMFRKLFGGGKADIILEDPVCPLECGIEIIARPPGKEPQSISLLSGGEKTMTAVALVMAVFKTRPSPFAILDEVDAALDESNTERFNMLLQEFLSFTQFVVITHSKRTMACADVLYGITMEEPGVSKRVSVRFDDRVQTPEVA